MPSCWIPSRRVGIRSRMLYALSISVARSEELVPMICLGCDTFMEIVDVRPDSECNKPCVADSTELCGAGSRIAVYQDTSASPPDPQQCLTNFQLFLISAVNLRVVLPTLPDDDVPTWLGGITFTEDTSVPQVILLTSAVSHIYKSYNSVTENYTQLVGEGVAIDDLFHRKYRKQQPKHSGFEQCQ